MSDTPLHEKKISELDVYTTRDPENEQNVITIDDLREWAIAVVKELKNTEADYVDSVLGYGDVSTKDRAQAVIDFLIDRFEIKPEEL